MPIHDHFDGSAHCVECKGPCKLTGDSLLLTSFVRYVLELRALRSTELPWLSFAERQLLLTAGADPDRLRKRAMETT